MPGAGADVLLCCKKNVSELGESPVCREGGNGNVIQTTTINTIRNSTSKTEADEVCGCLCLPYLG